MERKRLSAKEEERKERWEKWGRIDTGAIFATDTKTGKAGQKMDTTTHRIHSSLTFEFAKISAHKQNF